MTSPDHTGPAGNGRLLSVTPAGVATIERDGKVRHATLHRSLCQACLGPHPDDPHLMVLAFESGGGPASAETMLLVAVSADGLEALARALLAQVDRHREGRAIDLRYVL